MTQFFLYDTNLESFKKATQQNFFRKREDLTDATYKNAYALPPKSVFENGMRIKWGGITDCNNKYVKSSARFRNSEHTPSLNAMMGRYEFNQKSCPTLKGEYIYCGEYLDHWGHFLLESTTRLWYVVRHRKEHQKLIFVTKRGVKIEGNFKIFFKLLGISLKDVLLITEPTRLESVIVPECSSVINHYYTKEFMEPFRKITASVKASSIKRVYVSRRKFKFDFIMGEDKLEKLFKANDFKIVYPEKLPLDKLIALFKGADYIAGIIGSAIHNTIFCPKKTKVIILSRTSGYNTAQGLIDQATELDTTYVDSHFTFLPVLSEPYWVGITKNVVNMCKAFKFETIPVTPPTKKEVQIFINHWLNVLPKQHYYITEEGFKKTAPMAYEVFSNLTSVSKMHQKMDLLKYSILSKVSWGVHKKKYETKLKHYQEKYGVNKNL